MQDVDLRISLLDCFIQDSKQLELNRTLVEMKDGHVQVRGFAPRLKQIVEVIDRELEQYVNNNNVARINVQLETPSYYDELTVAFEDIFLRKQKSVFLEGSQISVHALNLRSKKVKFRLDCSLKDITDAVAKQYLDGQDNGGAKADTYSGENADSGGRVVRNASIVLDQLVGPVVDCLSVVSDVFKIPIAFGYNPGLGSNGLIYSQFRGNQYVKIVGTLSNIQKMTEKLGKFGKVGWLNLMQVPEAVAQVSEAKTKEEAGKVVGGTIGGMAGGEIGGNIGLVLGTIIIMSVGVVSTPAVIVTLGGCLIIGVVSGTVIGTKGGESAGGFLGKQFDAPTQRPLSSIEATISAAPEKKLYISAPGTKQTYFSAAPERKTYISAAPNRHQPLLYRAK